MLQTAPLYDAGKVLFWKPGKLLSEAISPEAEGFRQNPSGSEAPLGMPTFLAQNILGSKIGGRPLPLVPKKGRERRDKVVWRGYSRNDATWEPYENFIGDGALNCIKIFLEKRKARKTAKKADDLKFIMDSDGEEEELNRRKTKKRKLKTVKRPPPLKKSCRINNSDDNGDESSAPEVWLSDDDFESISPKRARFLDTILRDESSTASSSMARPGGVQQKKKTEHEGRKKTQNAKNQSAKTKKRHSAESSETPIDSLEHRKRKPKNIRNNLFENVGFSPPPDARIPGKPESRRPYVDTVEGTRFVPFNSQFVHFTQMPSRSQRE